VGAVVHVTWIAPAALWLLLAIPLVWVALFFSRTNFNRRQRLLQACIRSLLLAAIAAALARPVASGRSSRESVVYVVDVSRSVASSAITSAAQKIDDLNRALQPDHWRIVAFGTTARALDATDQLRQLANGPSEHQSVDRRGTDLQIAIEAARAELAPGHVPRIVLFTDGRPTAGDSAAAVARLTADRIPLSTESLAPRSLADAWIDRIELPVRIPAGSVSTVTVHVTSQRALDATVNVRLDGQELAAQKVQLAAGESAIPLSAAFNGAGSHVIEARLAAAADPLPVNNMLTGEAWVEPRAKVLYVESRPESAHYLARALTDSGFDVTVRPPRGVPTSSADFEPFDVAVLSDISRDAIPAAAMSALTDWVETKGGGLLVAGGESVFGEGGYRGTPLEHLTPVTFERRDEPEVALVLVLDRSWSMAGTSMNLCKAAAQAAVDVMTDEQAVGILTFNDAFAWDVTLRRVARNRDAIRKKIAAIDAGGHTLIFPAVEQAYLALHKARARAKHVIVLSDGRSYPADYETLVNKMLAAHITVSTVAVGPSADPELLRNIAKWGQGRAYVVSDARELPQIFVKEAKTAATPAFDEKEITPVVKAPAFLSSVDLTHLPRLKGRTATVLKDTALEVMATDDDDPLLAFWPIRLGRTAVFASDVKDRWGANWVRWRGYGPFFTAVMRALERHRAAEADLEVTAGPIHQGIRAIRIALEARDANGRYRNLLRPVVSVRTGGAAVADVHLQQTSPGRYEQTVVVDASQTVSVSLPGENTGVTTRLVLPDPAAEYRFRPPDVELLKTMANATGGVWQPTAASLKNAVGDDRTTHRPLSSALLVVALCLWFADIVARRVRLFEPSVADAVGSSIRTRPA
jgi:Ca-activated chloride channel family protein